MRIEQKKWTEAKGWTPEPPGALGDAAQLALIFGARSILGEQSLVAHLKPVYPSAHMQGCATAGEICGTQVTDRSLVATAVSFEHTWLKGSRTELNLAENSFQAG